VLYKQPHLYQCKEHITAKRGIVANQFLWLRSKAGPDKPKVGTTDVATVALRNALASSAWSARSVPQWETHGVDAGFEREISAETEHRIGRKAKGNILVPDEKRGSGKPASRSPVRRSQHEMHSRLPSSPIHSSRMGLLNVRFGSEADIRMGPSMSALPPIADMLSIEIDVC